MINPDLLAVAAPQNLTMVSIFHICALALFGLYIGFRSVSVLSILHNPARMARIRNSSAPSNKDLVV